MHYIKIIAYRLVQTGRDNKWMRKDTAVDHREGEFVELHGTRKIPLVRVPRVLLVEKQCVRKCTARRESLLTSGWAASSLSRFPFHTNR